MKQYPKLIYNGRISGFRTDGWLVIACSKALSQIYSSGNIIDESISYKQPLGQVHTLLGLRCSKLVARIQRYADGRDLEQPKSLNKEYAYFWAVKANCPSVVQVVEARVDTAKEGVTRERRALRAYFWHHLPQSERLMCISHFHIKTQQKLDDADTHISFKEKDEFERNGCYYES